jgi:hypothetical protein
MVIYGLITILFFYLVVLNWRQNRLADAVKLLVEAVKIEHEVMTFIHTAKQERRDYGDCPVE